MNGLNENFLDKEEKDESIEGGLVEMEGSGESLEDKVEDKVEEKEPWGYEVLPNGKLGAVDGLVDPEAGDLNQENPPFGSKDKIADVIIEGSQISLSGKSREELDVFFDTLEEISRSFFISQNTEVAGKSKKLRGLAEKYRENPDDFIKENSILDFKSLLNSE